MGSQYLRELCTLLICHHSGELHSRIFATLAQHGRLTIYSLAEHCKLPIRRIINSLGQLLDQQVLHHVAADDGLPTYYSVNWRNAYSIARHSNIFNLIQKDYGDGAAHLVASILQLGHARVGDLAEAYNLSSATKRDSGIDALADNASGVGVANGTDNLDLPGASSRYVGSLSEFHATLRALLNSGILAKIGPRSYIPPADLRDRIEEAVIADEFPDRKINGPKKQNEFKLAVNRLKRKWQNEDAYSDRTDLASKGVIKRLGDNASHNKRVKVNGFPAKGYSQEEAKLSDDLLVGVDFTRCVQATRIKCLQEQAKRYLGPVTASVYRALIECLVKKSKTGFEDLTKREDDDHDSCLPTATLSEIAEYLDPDIDLASSISGLSTGKSKPMPNGAGKRVRDQYIIEEDFSELGLKREYHSESEEEPAPNGFTSYRAQAKRVDCIKAHLLLLEEHSRGFCSRSRRYSDGNEWQIDFPAVLSSLVVAEIDDIIGRRYGKIAVRVVRILRKYGKLDDKQIAAAAMMDIDELRALLTLLQFRGILDVQELPREKNRNPAKTLFLWYFDQKRVQFNILHDTYKAMARTMQRVYIERKNCRNIIDKAERPDVKGREQEKLQQAEKIALREWIEADRKLFLQIAKMDEKVAILRDLSGEDKSLDG
ncbi:MAG: hypothetical protein FE78DRAFT_74503 [Acidomyces sp. 'richmondensis']|nr:MAG: hypothetical protein FE78DRAFT_74503 [Acidomyces sp. 'richmondensis']